MFVKAAPGLTIRDPDMFDYLPAEGREVPDTRYWQDRLRVGDVVMTSPAEPAPAETGAPE